MIEWESYMEAIAVAFGLWSVWLAQRNHVGVFPTGIVNTALYVVLLYRWNLLGDMLINAYYVIMSLHGWSVWHRNAGSQGAVGIHQPNPTERRTAWLLGCGAACFVLVVYRIFHTFTGWISALDTCITALFFVAMWMMTRRMTPHWILWMVGNVLSIPMYLYKGYPLTAIQYGVFAVMAYYGYRKWKTT